MPLPQHLLGTLPACFTASDHSFAGDAATKQQARELLSDLLKTDATLNELVKEIEAYLKSLNLSRFHITTQSLRAKNLETYW